MYYDICGCRLSLTLTDFLSGDLIGVENRGCDDSAVGEDGVITGGEVIDEAVKG